MKYVPSRKRFSNKLYKIVFFSVKLYKIDFSDERNLLKLHFFRTNDCKLYSWNEKVYRIFKKLELMEFLKIRNSVTFPF